MPTKTSRTTTPPASSRSPARKPAVQTASADPADAAPKPKAKTATAPQKTPAAAAPKKARPKLVRDGFTMPESDFALIAELKARAVKAQRPAKKSELLRAGLRALAALKAADLRAALEQLEPIQTGRPKKGH